MMPPENVAKIEYALLSLPAVEPLQQMLRPIIVKTEAYAITSDTEFAAVGDILDAINRATRIVNDAYVNTIQAWYNGHRTATAARKTFLDVLEDAEKKVKSTWAQYRCKKQDEAAEERRRLEEEARRRAENVRLETAIAMEEAGHRKEADAIISDPTPGILIIPDIKTPEVKGISVKQRFYGIIDGESGLRSLILAVASGKVPMTMLCVNQKNIDDFGQATKGKMLLPGVIWKIRDMVSNRRRVDS